MADNAPITDIDGGGMPVNGDTLRERIAAAIAGVDDWCGVTDPAILADAVIAALNLDQTLTNKIIVNQTPPPISAPGAGFGVNLYPVGAESNIPMTPRVYPKGEGRLMINGQSLTREAAEMFAKLRSTVPGEGLAGGGDRPGGEPIRGHWANAGPPIGLYPTRLPVHSHGPDEGAGMACRERWVDGRLIGACLPDAVTKWSHPDD